MSYKEPISIGPREVCISVFRGKHSSYIANPKLRNVSFGYSFIDSDCNIPMTISLFSMSSICPCILPTRALGRNCSILSIHWFSRNDLCTITNVHLFSFATIFNAITVLPLPGSTSNNPPPQSPTCFIYLSTIAV